MMKFSVQKATYSLSFVSWMFAHIHTLCKFFAIQIYGDRVSQHVNGNLALKLFRINTFSSLFVSVVPDITRGINVTVPHCLTAPWQLLSYYAYLIHTAYVLEHLKETNMIINNLNYFLFSLKLPRLFVKDYNSLLFLRK